jgi:hypothetical protein
VRFRRRGVPFFGDAPSLATLLAAVGWLALEVLVLVIAATR